MELKDLLEQGLNRAHDIKILTKEIENYDNIIEKAKLGKVSINNGPENTFIDEIIGNEKMEEIKGIVLLAMYEMIDMKINEYKRITGLAETTEEPKAVKEPPRKPEVPNTEFKQETNEIVEDKQPKIRKVSLLTVETVKDLYHDQMLSMDAIAKKTGTTKQEVHDFIGENGLKRPGKRDRETFRDTAVQSARRS